MGNTIHSKDDFLMFAIAENESRLSAIPLPPPPGMLMAKEMEDPSKTIQCKDDFLMFAIAENESRLSATPLPPPLSMVKEKEDLYDACWMLDEPVAKSEIRKVLELTSEMEEEYLRHDTASFNRFYAIYNFQNHGFSASLKNMKE